MTTLELAAKIARAVADAVYDSGWVLGERAEEQAHVVLRVLREHDAWFCRCTIDEAGDGTHGATHEAPYEQVQLEMFP